jgi:hypothetical protein
MTEKDVRDEQVPVTKPFWRSLTLWVNGLAFLALLYQSVTGGVIYPEEQTAVIILVNMILRLITKTGLEA